MLLFYYGNDFQRKHKKVNLVLNDLKKKRPGANYFYFDSFDIDIEKIKELILAQGLFETKNIIFFSNLFLNKDIKKFILENLEKIKNSESAFVFSEENLTKKEIDEIKKYAFKIEEFKKNNYYWDNVNLFSISNFIQRKDKKNAWIFYRENIRKKNADAESFYNIIFWSLKSMLIVENFDEMSGSGLKDSVIKNAQRNLKYWKDDELFEKVFELLKIQIKARQGKENLEESLELFLLEL